jgi:lysophospholipase L1-like esterase
MTTLAAVAGSSPPGVSASTRCTKSTSVTVRAPKGVRRAVVFVNGRRRGSVRRGSPRRIRLHRGDVTIRLVGRTRSGRRVTRVRHLRVCSAPTVPAPVPGHVDPADPHLRYEGRWDVKPGRAVTVNSGSRVFLRFTGDAVTARFDTAGITKPPHIYAYVDGKKSDRIVVDHDTIRLTPAGLANGTHTLLMAVKDVSEQGERWKPPFASVLQLTGFDLPSGTVLDSPPAPASSLRFTFLGDSITQGVNILCPVPGSDCADGTLDYAWRVADAFGTQLEQVGFGAQGVTRGGNGGVPPASGALDFNFEGSPAGPFDANVVVINQGTNDAIGQASSDEIAAKYLEYLHKVRARYPNSFIIALETFGFQGTVTGSASAGIQSAVEQFGDPRTKYVSTRGWLGPGDFTEGLHPNDQGHQKATARLIETITQLTGLQRKHNP